MAFQTEFEKLADYLKAAGLWTVTDHQTPCQVALATIQRLIAEKEADSGKLSRAKGRIVAFLLRHNPLNATVRRLRKKVSIYRLAMIEAGVVLPKTA